MMFDYSIIDIFGIGIGLRYMNREQYQSKFGAIMSILIGALICVQVILVGQELFLKENPDVIYSERFVASPERFYMKRDSYNFAFGVQFPGNYSHFIDETIYYVEAEQVYMTKVFNQEQNNYEQKWSSRKIEAQPCEESNFGVTETFGYFSTLPNINQMYCLSQTEDLFMEGNFDQDQYSYVSMTMKLCKDKPTCRPIEEIKQILTNSFVAIYANDLIVNPKTINPFTVVANDRFWNASPTIAKDIYLFYRNIYVESDKGIFFEEKSYERSTAVSYASEQVLQKQNQLFRWIKFFPLTFDQLRKQVLQQI